MQVKTIRQSGLSGECWSVQIWGLDRCERCEHRGTEDCGGEEIRKTGKNSKGIAVPLAE
jgi:hypothetical protein